MGRRAIPGGALALALTALFTSLVHMGAIRHERCAEHGELVEVTARSTGAAAHHGTALPVDSLAALDREAADHDHCPLCVTPAMATPARALVQVTTLHRPLAVLVETPARLAVTDDVLGNAPKQGPPRHDV